MEEGSGSENGGGVWVRNNMIVEEITQEAEGYTSVVSLKIRSKRKTDFFYAIFLSIFLSPRERDY